MLEDVERYQNRLDMLLAKLESHDNDLLPSSRRYFIAAGDTEAHARKRKEIEMEILDTRKELRQVQNSLARWTQ